MPSLSCPAYSFVPAQLPLLSSNRSLPQNFQTSFAVFQAQILPTVQSPFPSRRTGMSKRPAPSPGAVVNEEEVVIPNGSFFPLNLDPHGGETASPSDSERRVLAARVHLHRCRVPRDPSRTRILEWHGRGRQGAFVYFHFSFVLIKNKKQKERPPPSGMSPTLRPSSRDGQRLSPPSRHPA